jgi:hypothetical protein
MGRTNLASAAMLLAVLLSGCVPLPHFITTVPEVKGRLVRAGVPIANAQVSARAGLSQVPCEWEPASARTSADGLFRVSPQTEFRLIYRPLLAPLVVNAWEVCIEYEGTKLLGYRGVNLQSRSDALSLSCDLDKRYAQIERGIQGACEVVPTAGLPTQPIPGSDG